MKLPPGRLSGLFIARPTWYGGLHGTGTTIQVTGYPGGLTTGIITMVIILTGTLTIIAGTGTATTIAGTGIIITITAM